MAAADDKAKRKGGRKAVRTVHLWLGLISGLVVFIVAITGCIYAFQEEIQDLMQEYRFVEPGGQALLHPSEIRSRADVALPGKDVHSVQYEETGRAARVTYYLAEEYYYVVYVNPYSGAVLEVKNMDRDFFRIVLDGHFYLWLPHKIGQPLIATSCLVFVVMLITGIILWWPKNRAGIKQRFRFQFTGRWRRKNYSLHTVSGFYSSWLALILALTGLVWGFDWFENGVYTLASGGKEYKKYKEPSSFAAQATTSQRPEDMVWLRMTREYPPNTPIEIHFPHDEKGSIAANANLQKGTYWKRDFRYFDQYSLKELSVDHTWGRFQEAGFADKVMRMNYDIHVGAIGGLAGKTLAFLVSLFVAVLPVSGFLIWYGRRRKKNVAVPEERVSELQPSIQTI